MRRTSLYPASMLAMAAVLASASAQAQVVGTITPGAPAVPVASSPDDCADGPNVTGQVGGYNVAPGGTLGDTTNGGTTAAAGQSIGVVCTAFIQNRPYSVSSSGLTTFGGDLATRSQSGSGSTSYTFSRETAQVYDTTGVSPVATGAPIVSDIQTSPLSSGAYNYTKALATLQKNLYSENTSVSGTGTTGTGSQAVYRTQAGSSSWAETTGDSTFDPATGNVTYTPTAGKEATQNIDGNIVRTYDNAAGTSSTTEQNANGFTASTTTSAGGSSTTYGATGIENTGAFTISGGGNSYVAVNPNSVVLHGGTSSTNVTVDNGGIAVVDTTTHPGGLTTLTLDNNGNLTIAGTLSANGINNNGNVISNIADGVLATDAASVGQVNAGDAATLSSAKTYTDTKVAAQAAATLTSAEAYTDTAVAAEATARIAGDAATLASANAYTDTSVTAERTARIAGDAATLASANTYTDTSVTAERTARIAGDAATLASANTYTDTSVTAERTARIAGDAATLASSKSYTDTSVSAEATSRIAADLAESTARIAGDNALRADLTTETNARIAADGELRDRIASSTATAIALGGTAILPDTNFTLAGNVGFYQGAQALAVNAAARVAPHAFVTGAVGGGLNKHGEIGGRVGFVFGF